MSQLTKLITIPKIVDDACLFFAESDKDIPFKIKRVYYITKPKSGEPRGFHAHHQTDQILFCLQGKVKMVLDDGFKREEIVLQSPEVGILLPKMVWHEMYDMNQDTILLVLASKHYEALDYIRKYEQFIKLVHDDKV